MGGSVKELELELELVLSHLRGESLSASLLLLRRYTRTYYVKLLGSDI